MRRWWYRLQSTRWWIRRPTKWVLFAGVTFLTLFPYPRVFLRHVEHLRNLDRLPDPTDPALVPVKKEFLDDAASKQLDLSDSAQLLQEVQTFVYRKVPYAWDWDNWGVVDYIPTVAEVIARGREDCDGRAVLAAALLGAMGVDCQLVGDPRHVWVQTPMGDIMNPLGEPVLVHADKHWNIAWLRLIDLGPPAFGAAIFPLRRELIILLAAWVLLLPRQIRWSRAGIGLVLLFQGLLIVRICGADPVHPVRAGIYLGLLNVAVAVFVVAVWGRKHKGHTDRPVF